MEALTPAEMLVLLDPGRSQSKDALKTTLLSLVTQGVLRMVPVTQKRLFGSKSTPSIATAAKRPTGATHLGAVYDLVQAAGLGQPAALDKIALAARKRWGAKLDGFKTQYLTPALINRKLLREEQRKALFIIPYKALVHTPAGLLEKQRVEGLVAQARRLPELLRSNPTEAAAIALAAGGALLLVPQLQAHYAELAALRRRNSSDTSDSSDGSWSSSSNDWPFGSGSSSDLANLDATTFDSDSFSSFDSSFDSSFSSSDSSSSDSGGGDSGGGGDGGGGGGD